jgi:hypothetical protein
VLLTATDFRLATCPLSQPLEVTATRELVREHVLDDVAFPQLVLRVGWAPVSGEPLPATPAEPSTECSPPHPDEALTFVEPLRHGGRSKGVRALRPPWCGHGSAPKSSRHRASPSQGAPLP